MPNETTCCIFNGLHWNSQRGLGRFNAQLIRHIDSFGWRRITLWNPRWESAAGRLLTGEVAEPIQRVCVRPDIAIYPYNTVPVFSRHRSGLTVLVLHDLLFTLAENKKTPGNLYRNVMLRHSLAAADLILTVSRASRDLILEITADTVPIHVISNVLPEKFRNPAPVAIHREHKSTTILHFGGSAPSKNTRSLLAAIHKLKKMGCKVTLLLVAMASNRKLAQAWMQAENLTSDDVVILPHLTDSELIELYSQVDVHCMPSIGEGFGIPVIEAARCRVPNILTPLPVFREIMGKDAIFTHGFAADDIAAAILEFLSTETSLLISRAAARTDSFLFEAVHDHEAAPAFREIEALRGSGKIQSANH